MSSTKVSDLSVTTKDEATIKIPRKFPGVAKAGLLDCEVF